MTADNDYQVEQWEGHPWYPAIRKAHEKLDRAIPGYRIEHIEEKIHGLVFKYNLPEELDTDEYQARAKRIVSYAEGWVDGFEYSPREETQ